ncbi:MAG: monovalent cation/H+ antiporter subunit D, partial [Pseudomonadota bacterium]|nr:monovalent cation/H+ antiporter subunit D [Pseudomonadota bacterium]
RAGSTLFWKSAAIGEGPLPAARWQRTADLMPATTILLLLAVLTVLAGPAMDYMDKAAAQLFLPTAYIEAVLGGQGR